MSKHKIFYTEDDQTLAFLTKESLEDSGFDIIHCNNGNMCLSVFLNDKFDICILDVMMPNIDGFELATAIRSVDSNIPILFLSAKTLKEDRIKAFKIGADDYLVKPFSMDELVLKIEVFLRRSQKQQIQNVHIIKIGVFDFDVDNYLISTTSSNTKLTQRESALLQFFVKNKNLVLKREQILIQLWGSDDYFLGRSLDVFVSRLRKILLEDKSLSIENLHGIGFRFNQKN